MINVLKQQTTWKKIADYFLVSFSAVVFLLVLVNQLTTGALVNGTVFAQYQTPDNPKAPETPSCEERWEFKYPQCTDGNQVADVYQNTCTGEYQERNIHTQPGVCGAPEPERECHWNPGTETVCGQSVAGGQANHVCTYESNSCDGSTRAKDCWLEAGVCGHNPSTSTHTETERERERETSRDCDEPGHGGKDQPAFETAECREKIGNCFEGFTKDGSGICRGEEREEERSKKQTVTCGDGSTWTIDAGENANTICNNNNNNNENNNNNDNSSNNSSSNNSNSSNSSNNYNQNTQSQSQGSVFGYFYNFFQPAAAATAAPTAAPTARPTSAPAAQVKGSSDVKELPKTGLPLVGWALMGLLPVGYKLRKFGTAKEESVSANSLWADRQMKK